MRTIDEIAFQTNILALTAAAEAARAGEAGAPDTPGLRPHHPPPRSNSASLLLHA